MSDDVTKLDAEMAAPRAPAGAAFVIRPDGRIVFDGIMVGTIADQRIILNAGWLRAAGAHLTVENDPTIDRGRSGIILDR